MTQWVKLSGIFPCLLLTLLLAACQTPHGLSAERVLVTLVFGRSIAGGGQVSDEAWQGYVREVLAQKTPGFTVLDCQGGWMNGGRVEQEGCKWVVILATPTELPRVAEAVRAYRQRFSQESVLWLEQPCAREHCRYEATPGLSFAH
ncbi:MAG: DUF3574 domain-containing protein [Magnetococcus sp. YQC-3]